MTDSECQYHGNPFRDTYKFDNVLISIINIFQIITLEGWTDMMYIVRESEGTIAFDFLFVACVLFGAFFVLNLMIAVQFTYLGAAFDEEDEIDVVVVRWKRQARRETRQVRRGDERVGGEHGDDGF